MNFELLSIKEKKMESVIVLNANYQFWCKVGIERAIIWKFQNKVHVVKEHPTWEYRSVSLSIKVPLVVRLLNFVGYKPKSEKIPFSVNAVYERDKNVCQYWHYENKQQEDGTTKRIRFKYQCTIEDRTIDHIKPISRGGKSSFENCVCCCRICNEIHKKNKTPAEAGLHLWKRPVAPVRDIHQFVFKIPVFNPRNLADKIYQEEVLGKEFSHIV